MKILELGSGSMPLQGAVHHDRIKHSDWIDVAWDLEVLPWPCKNEEWDEIYAIDVFEHLNIEIVDWLSECHRVIKPEGKLTLRLPAWDNELSYRDPTHKKFFITKRLITLIQKKNFINCLGGTIGIMFLYSK